MSDTPDPEVAALLARWERAVDDLTAASGAVERALIRATDGSCASCAHWTLPEEYCEPAGFGACSRAGSDYGKPDDAASSAVAIDFEGYRAALRTHPDHYCAMWVAGT